VDAILPDLRRFTILVVEDDADTADLVTTSLEACGATVYTARRAEQARLLLTEIRPQAIVCDLCLPQEDGVEFARWVRSHASDGGRHAALIAYTAYDAYFRRAVVPGGGFAAVVKKPSDPGHLCAVISDILQGPRPGSPAR
jgi:DNA-binding response OmpR family regulator